MAEQAPDTNRGDRTDRSDRAEDRVTRWVKPDYQIVETSMEVTAYFGAES